MGKKRVHELAKEYGLDIKEVLQRLQAAGIDVKTHSSSVYEEEAKAALDNPAPEPDAASARRPGMMIVKKKRDIEQETSSEDGSALDIGTETSGVDGDTEAIAAGAHDAPNLTMPQPEPSFDASLPVDAATSAVPAREASSTLAAPPEAPSESETASLAEDLEPRSGDAAAPQLVKGEAPGGSPRTPTRPGAATVVRMIDRDKLMERVPSRRLGGGATQERRGPPREGGAPGQRFGQVTELKVVTDPFGRGREMINVARDRKGKPTTVARPLRKDKVPSKRDLLEMRERGLHPSRLKRKKAQVKGTKRQEVTERKASKRVIRVNGTIVVADLAHQLGVKVNEVIAKLMGLGMMVSQNQCVDTDTAQLVAADYQYTVESTAFDEQGALAVMTEEEDEAALKQPRSPVVTVMGHVDHGKTSLLDAIRKARVAAGEAGGITQHIGAYQVEIPEKGSVTFLDTPGHAAFTAMRARGAQATDLVVLVVAADDGVMPQTEEAVKHAQAAEVPIIVAVNKIDKPDAKPERVMQELASKFELTPEAWGGETLYVNTSATNGTGITELLDAILLQAEVLELLANPDRAAIGVVLEARLDKGRGPVATVLVQTGTLKRGDAIVVGDHCGRVRAMQDDCGQAVNEAGPAVPVEITGLEGVPESGDVMHAVENAERAREIVAHRVLQKRNQEAGGRAALTLEDMMTRIKGEGTLEFKIVLKADVQGSAEAVRDALVALSTPEVKVTVVYSGVGAISESDVTLAVASGGVVVGFNVRPDASARELARREGVELRSYGIIYEVIDDVRLAMQGLLAPQSREKLVGHAEVRELFKVSKVGQIAGSRVLDGKAQRSARVRILRDNVPVHDGTVSSLKHFKNDVREVESGQECGVGITDYNDVKVGDVLEFYQIEEVARTLPLTQAAGKREGLSSSAHP